MSAKNNKHTRMHVFVKEKKNLNRDVFSKQWWQVELRFFSISALLINYSNIFAYPTIFNGLEQVFKARYYFVY